MSASMKSILITATISAITTAIVFRWAPVRKVVVGG